MDGFDVGGFKAGVVYDLNERLARYLIVAGYAVAEPRRSVRFRRRSHETKRDRSRRDPQSNLR
jgi:hypothetical protein